MMKPTLCSLQAEIRELKSMVADMRDIIAADARMHDRLLTVKQAADILGLTIWRVYRMVNDGTLPCKIIGKKTIRLSLKEINNYAHKG